MPISSFEIRVCLSCRLRYPLAEGSTFGKRCPHCLGETEIVITKQINTEPSQTAKPTNTSKMAVLLDNIRSAWNVGSILRSADGFGFEHVYLCGISPTPENEAVTKTSLGAEDFVTWSVHKNAVDLVIELKKQKWKIYALEKMPKAKDIQKFKMGAKEKAVLILGSEVTGTDPALLKLADEVVSIPMRGGKRSFNVSVAFAIAAYALQIAAAKHPRKTTPRSKLKPRTTSAQ